MESITESKDDVSENMEISPTIQDPLTLLIEQLAIHDRISCKSQQKDETDISTEEKIKILTDIYQKSKPTFLYRFGYYLNAQQLNFFKQFENNPVDGYEISYQLKKISEQHSKKQKRLRNKRYAALKHLEKDSYFSENEMKKRNPLLYEQLVGRYLSLDERKLKERANRSKTFVGILLDGIDTEEMELKKWKQEEAEHDAANLLYSSDSESSADDFDDTPQSSSRKRKQDEMPSTSYWGEMEESDHPKRIKPPLTDNEISITAQERKLLKEEFVNSMYESFLEGQDEDFDYTTVDDNEEYDNLEILTHDEEEKYFDSEEPEDINMQDDNKHVKEESSEDELDIYMNALNQHPAVCKLSEDMKNL